jgi:hypothetical protein
VYFSCSARDAFAFQKKNPWQIYTALSKQGRQTVIIVFYMHFFDMVFAANVKCRKNNDG